MNYDIIVIGGGPAGMISAITAKKYDPDKTVLLIKSVANGVIPCGIPYMFSTLKNPEDNAVGDKPLELNNIELKIDEVININKQKKEIQTKSNDFLGYGKLIIATGSKPITPPIEGVEKKGIYLIVKELNHLKNLKKDIQKADNIVIIGGGFIGVEFADELSQMKGKKITLIEFMPNILMNSFDQEFSNIAKEELIKKGVNLITEKKAVKFTGSGSEDGRVNYVLLSDNSKIDCQVVIFGIGALPNSGLAEDSGLNIGNSKGILVDEYLRTSDPDIFAVGDCSEKKDFFTRKKIPIMLASVACAEARIAASNLYKIKVVRENKGTMATYSTKISNLTFGSAGLTEKSAIKEGFEIVVGNAEGVDKHPEAMPGANKFRIKLIFSKQGGILLGGQIVGGASAGEIVNTISLALQKTTTLTELETLQVATHPKLTAAPTMYPIIIAAQDALGKYSLNK